MILGWACPRCGGKTKEECTCYDSKPPFQSSRSRLKLFKGANRLLDLGREVIARKRRKQFSVVKPLKGDKDDEM